MKLINICVFLVIFIIIISNVQSIISTSGKNNINKRINKSSNRIEIVHDAQEVHKDGRVAYEAEEAHATGNVYSNYDHAVLSASGSGGEEGHLIFTVFVKEDDDYNTGIHFKHVEDHQFIGEDLPHTCSLIVSINGLSIGMVQMLSLSAFKYSYHVEKFKLRQGLNTIVFKSNDFVSVSLDKIQVEGALLQATRGATLPYFEMEAESGTVTGVIIGPDRTPLTLASESSGRKAVQFTTSSHNVVFTLPSSANALVIRYSIPDSADGTGNTAFLGVYVNNVQTLNLTVTSKYSWVYGSYPFNNNPSGGSARHFYDEVRSVFPSTLAAGTKVKLAGLSSLTYTIDFVDFYTVPAPYAQPSGYLSVTTYGADPTGVKDSTSAFTTTIATAQNQGHGVYIPQGTYLITSHFGVNHVTIRGAGPFYSVLTTNTAGAVGFYGASSPGSQGVGLYDFAIMGITTARVDSSIDGGVGGAFDSTSIFQNLWIEHTKVGMWLDGPFSGLHITGLVIRNTWADGINLHIGVSNVIIEQSMIRNTGDDCIALWSENQADTNNIIRFNTVQLPILANTIGIYGGSGNSITDNMVADTVVEGAGLQASNRFSAVALSGVTTFARNTLTRCGGPNGDNTSGRNGALWIWASDSAISGTINVTYTDIIDSSYSAITFWGLTTLNNAWFSNINVVTAPYVVSVWGTSGSAYFQYTVGTSIATSGVCSCMSGKFVINSGPGNSGWNSTQCVSTC